MRPRPRPFCERVWQKYRKRKNWGGDSGETSLLFHMLKGEPSINILIGFCCLAGVILLFDKDVGGGAELTYSCIRREGLSPSLNLTSFSHRLSMRDSCFSVSRINSRDTMLFITLSTSTNTERILLSTQCEVTFSQTFMHMVIGYFISNGKETPLVVKTCQINALF